MALMSFSAGLLAGAATALIMAPMRGRDMRARLRERAPKLFERATPPTPQDPAPRATPIVPSERLTAPLGEIAHLHGGPGEEAWS